ncbi:MAG: helix-turn-helix transcriptional regulator, partial [Planctomycetes bacterium]|nr:helix-turn-helix transcriptional regulator [Planctomycetota bacterium]
GGPLAFRPLGVMRRETTARAAPPADPRVLDAVALIRARACSGLRLDDVVAVVKSSRRFATKLFREVTGESILEEVRRVRFEMAKVLLSRPGGRLAEVAARCGYESVPTFCREFKRVAGATPEAWRARRLALGG